MPLTHSRLDALTQEHIQALVDNSVRENQRIDFKRDLPGATDADKREFMADISAFANTSGGDLVYGIDEIDGQASQIVGIGAVNVDQEILRLEAIVRAGVDPRIQGIGLRGINVGSETVLVIRVPRSLAAPHVVIAGNVFRFYGRTSAGKYQLDVRELRSLFALSGTLEERVRRFRADRLAKVLAKETGFALKDGPKIVMHLIPLMTTPSSSNLVLDAVADTPTSIPPLSSYGFDFRYNLDGFATFCSNEDGVIAYTQVFRDGSIEAVDALLLGGMNGTAIPTTYLENKLLEMVPKYLAAQTLMGVVRPVVIMLSILGVEGYTLAVADTWSHLGTRRIDRPDLLLPEVVVQETDIDVTKILRPIFDSLWNAGGWPRSMNYSENGVRQPR